MAEGLTPEQIRQMIKERAHIIDIIRGDPQLVQANAQTGILSILTRIADSLDLIAEKMKYYTEAA